MVIDGEGVCCMLYRKSLPWALGGEYDKFSAVIEAFFNDVGFNNPIVVLDGAESDNSKLDTVCKHREQAMGEMLEMQSGSGWVTDDITTATILPPLIISTFISVLKKMKITCFVADDEGDQEIAALANHYKCPVFSSDSDFFIFNLEHGFIHFNRFYSERNPLSLYYNTRF